MYAVRCQANPMGSKMGHTKVCQRTFKAPMWTVRAKLGRDDGYISVDEVRPTQSPFSNIAERKNERLTTDPYRTTKKSRDFVKQTSEPRPAG